MRNMCAFVYLYKTIKGLIRNFQVETFDEFYVLGKLCQKRVHEAILHFQFNKLNLNFANKKEKTITY